MAVRWTIAFKTLTERDGLVKVYDSTFSGTAIALTPAAEISYLTKEEQDRVIEIIHRCFL